MTDVRARLERFFGETATRRLARAALATLLASATGVTLAALLGAPGFAATGAGIIIGGIAINIASSLLEKLVMLPLDADDEREALIEQGLAQRDSAMTTLVAATLIEAGPELSQALPVTGRVELIAGMVTAMQQAGGLLTAMAPRFGAALRDPCADWSAVQAELRHTIERVTQTMEASEESQIEDSHQRTEHVTGSVEQHMRASKGSRISGSSQTTMGGSAAHQARRCPDCGLPVPAGQRFCGSCGAAMGGAS
jgi:hypothetical protein